MSWVFGPGGGGTPGGADKDIQFNNNGEFSGSSLLTTDGSGSLSASTHVSASTFYGDGSNLTGVTASAVQVADGPQYSLQFRYDSPVSGDLSGSSDLLWDPATGDVLISGSVRLEDGKEFYGDLEGAILFPAKVDEVGGIGKGKVVYIKGLSGTTPTIGLAACDNPATMPAFGLCAISASNNANTQVATFGSLDGLNLNNISPGHSFSEGDVLYVNTGSGGTAGTFTNIKPTGSNNLVQNIGKVVRNGVSSNAQIKVGGAGRANDTPNLDKGHIFVGNDTDQTIQDSTIFISASANRVGINNTSPDHTLTVGGDISASVNISGSNFYTNNYLYADRAYLGVAGTGFIVSRTDATTFMKMQTAGGNNSINFTLGGAKLVDILENGVDQVSLGATSGDTIHISGSLTASVGMRVSASAAIGDDIVVGAGSTRTIGAQIEGSDDFFVMGNAGGAVTLSASSGVEFLADDAEGVMAIATPITVFSDLDANNAVVSLSTSGDISGSGNISGSGLYAENVFVSSVPANRVLVSDTNGKVTSHSPFTFTSDVLAVPTITASVGISSSLLIVDPTSGSLAGAGSYLGLNSNNQIIVTSSAGGGGGTPGGSNTEVQINDGGSFGGDSTFTFNKTSNVLSVPTITASVGIQTEALEVSSSANGSINIGEGISYVQNGVDRLDVFENEFKFQNVNLYQGVSTENTSNFNIRDKQVFLVDTNSSVVTGTLPGVNSSDDYGVTFIIKDSGGNAGTNDIIIEPSGSQKIDGASAAKIATNYGAMTVVAISSSVNGLGWGIVSAT